ncbi:Uncharacterised protein [Streptococcus pasteurianus]|nr:Uncharacterised protein [Streptococcus pasteurianus]
MLFSETDNGSVLKNGPIIFEVTSFDLVEIVIPIVLLDLCEILFLVKNKADNNKVLTVTDVALETFKSLAIIFELMSIG